MSEDAGDNPTDEPNAPARDDAGGTGDPVDDMTSEQLEALIRNPEFLKLLTPEQRAELEARQLDYLRCCQADDFAQARLADSNREMFRSTVRIVEQYRRNPQALEIPAAYPCDAVRQRIRRLIDEGEEVDDAFVEELIDLQARFGPPPSPPAPPDDTHGPPS